MRDFEGEAKSIAQTLRQRYPLIDWSVGWDGPDELVFRAELSINDAMERPQILRNYLGIEIDYWDTATVDMFELVAKEMMRELDIAVLRWQPDDEE